MKDFVTRFRNDFLNKCGLTSSINFVKIFIPQFRAQDGTSARTKLGSG